jgi:hypothetical protein
MFLKKVFLKFFDKNQYDLLKYKARLQKKIIFFKNKIQPELSLIRNNLKKKEISFLHSGHLGDILYSLPVIKELSKSKKCNLYIEKNCKIGSFYFKHPGKDFFLNKKMTDMLIPLLKNQPYLNKVDIYNKQNIDINLNIFRKLPFNLTFTSRVFFQVTGIHADLKQKYIFSKKKKIYNNKIILLRSFRYRNYLINYDFLKNSNNIIFIGLYDEYLNMKKIIKKLIFYKCKNFLDMAEIINSCKFFIGNQSFGYALAEGLKVPRLLESYPDANYVYPYGKRAYDFFFQEDFEKFFSKLNK